jgi:hypothetical protein
MSLLLMPLQGLETPKKIILVPSVRKENKRSLFDCYPLLGNTSRKVTRQRLKWDLFRRYLSN